MDARYRGTVVEELLPLIGKDAAAVLKSHGASKEHYVLWLYKRAANATGVETAVVMSLCVTLLAALVTTLFENDGMTINGTTLTTLLGIAGMCAVILALTAWTMRHSTMILNQYLRSASFLHKTSTTYLQTLSRSTWNTITLFEPDIDHFRLHNAVHRKPPALTVAQQRRIAFLRPWCTLTGWIALGALTLMFFVGESSLNIVSASTLTAVGTWLTLRSIQMYMAGQIVDRCSGLTTFGKPARLIAVTAIACSLALVVIGIAGILFTL